MSTQTCQRISLSQSTRKSAMYRDKQRTEVLAGIRHTSTMTRTMNFFDNFDITKERWQRLSFLLYKSIFLMRFTSEYNCVGDIEKQNRIFKQVLT